MSTNGLSNGEILDRDPYNSPDPFWKRHAEPLGILAVFISTVFLTVVSFAPFGNSEAAYVFAVPALFWAYRSPAWKPFSWVVLGASAVAWTLVLSWLHHVSWLGLFLLGPVIGIWVGSWFLAARWLMPRLLGRPHLTRILAVFGLAALWVINEWLRTWLFSGFPWLPLAASQWQRLSVLQIASFTGAGGVSFVLISLHIGSSKSVSVVSNVGARNSSRRCFSRSCV
ncbi:MAG TPA: hypothetical protein PLN52_02645 [Opitutaceae bacterium]|nr:hypothetical protein [Opitutaceae bacterium]